jgi:hypothetical protein
MAPELSGRGDQPVDLDRGQVLSRLRRSALGCLGGGVIVRLSRK